MKRFPLLPIPLRVASKIIRRLYRISTSIARFFPQLKIELAQADIALSTAEYISLSIFTSFLYFIFLFLPILFLVLKRGVTMFNMLIAIGAPLSLGAIIFFYLLFYPKLSSLGRIRRIERDLLPALRHTQIKVRAGIPLYDVLLSIAKGKYGLVSKEFEKFVKEVEGGKPEIEALESLALRNPSMHFRRVIWQIANALKAGTKVSETLYIISDTLAREQRIAVRKYGSELNPIALMYMILSVVFPSIGIAFVIILSSLAGFEIPSYLFYLIPPFLLVVQIFFLNFINTRRPVVEV
jgi:flagellar protein FlaJ